MYGWTCLLPALVAVVAAVASRRPLESLLAGVVAGLLLLEPGAVLGNFSDILLQVMMEETVAWVIIVCGLMGSLIALLMRSGATVAFSDALARRANSAGAALLYTWLLGLMIFIDDYLNALAVGSSMRKLTDRFRVSREMLAYVVDSTAAPVCMLAPVSTWAVFFAGTLEVSGAAEPGGGMALFITSIPYMLYPWLAVLMTLLVAVGRMPLLGPMRTAQARAALAPRATASRGMAPETVAPETIVPETIVPEVMQPEAVESEGMESAVDGACEETPGSARVYHFLLPLLALLGFSAWYDLDVQAGVIAALFVTVAVYGLQRLLAWGEMFDTAMEGIKLMVPALSIVVVVFVFKEVNDRLGMAPWVIESVKPWLNPTLAPAAVFIAMALVSFTTGSSWGVFAIAIPIVLPLADSLGVSMPLTIGALMSASAFGSHACFYSDSTVLAAQGSGCGVMEHALTQIPYAALAAACTVLGLTLLA